VVVPLGQISNVENILSRIFEKKRIAIGISILLNIEKLV
jgi:hypothetical protein